MMSSVRTSLRLLSADPVDLYDDFEPEYPSPPLEHPAALGLSVRELSRAPVSRLAGLFDDLSFADALAASKATPSKSGDLLTDDYGLVVYGTIHVAASGKRTLLITSFGEFQPARYMAFLLSSWEIVETP
jgi:hypothetical protein